MEQQYDNANNIKNILVHGIIGIYLSKYKLIRLFDYNFLLKFRKDD